MAAAKIPVRIKGQTTCFYHKGWQLELYCEKCQELTCVKCVSSIHKGHLLCDLSEITRRKKQDIKNFVGRTEENKLLEIGNYIASTNILLNENNSTFEKLAQQVRAQTERLKQELDTLTANTLSMYQKMKVGNTVLIQKYKQDLVRYDKQLKNQMLDCKKVLQQGSHIEIYDTECEIDSRIHLPVKPVLSTACFTPNENPRYHLELALGTSNDSGQMSTLRVRDRSVSVLHGQGQSSTHQESGGTRKSTVAKTKLLTETRVLEEWKSPSFIYSICPTTDDQAWTSNYSETLTLLDRKGKVIQEVTHKASINDISLSPTTHRLWVCDDQNSILELLSGQLSERFRTKDIPKCICVTSDSHIIIGMSTHVTKYTTRGQMVLTTETARTPTPLVCSPWRITVCPITNNIAVIDLGYKSDGGDDDQRVVIMDIDFRTLFLYRGDNPSIYKETSKTGNEPFQPRDIVYDSQGNIIIADYGNDKIQILNGDGAVLRILDKDTDEIWAVGVSKQGVLWTSNMYNNVKLQCFYIV